MDTLGVERAKAMEVVERIAFNSVPPQRFEVYAYLRWSRKCEATSTRKIAEALDLPTNTVRRRLEELAAYRVVRRGTYGQGKSDKWETGRWGQPNYPQADPAGDDGDS